MIQLEKAFAELDLFYDPSVAEKYKKYMEGILEWNEKVNLTTITEPDEFIKKHYIDSLLCVPYKEFQNAESIVDVGTGGGFPGIPLALAAPDKEFILIDSLNKRIRIIDQLCRELDITNVTAIHGRAEELARRKEYRQKFDLCVSRAVANLATLSEYCLPFIRKGGWFLAYKGPDSDKESREATKALHILGGNIRKEEKAGLADFDLDHRIIFIEKIKDTPSKYPRKAGTPSKDPLK